MKGPAPDRKTGLCKLHRFVDRAGRDYARLRNFDLGESNHQHVSQLSPYLRHRLVLEEEVLQAVLNRHRLSAAEKFVQEVFWRTYFKGWLEQYPSIWSDYRAAVDDLSNQLESNSGLRHSYEQAVRGNTGIGCFDHWVRELTTTGYLHNHARMWFASIWVFTLELPWQLGADFFYRNLLDGDPASNTLGWRWVCGLHTKGKTYLARRSNIAEYTKGRFDQAGQLATSAKALTENRDAVRLELTRAAAAPVDGTVGLLVTPEDCNVETLPLTIEPTAILGVAAVADRSPLPVNALVHSFSAGAVDDGVQRAAEAFASATTTCVSGDWIETVVEWAKNRSLTSVVTAYAPVGPVADKLAQLQPRLDQLDVTLVRLHRDFDRQAWPHTAKGFFGLKKQIPGLLGSLQLMPAIER